VSLLLRPVIGQLAEVRLAAVLRVHRPVPAERRSVVPEARQQARVTAVAQHLAAAVADLVLADQ
jgi:hypothetical protein